MSKQQLKSSSKSAGSGLTDDSMTPYPSPELTRTYDVEYYNSRAAGGFVYQTSWSWFDKARDLRTPVPPNVRDMCKLLLPDAKRYTRDAVGDASTAMELANTVARVAVNPAVDENFVHLLTGLSAKFKAVAQALAESQIRTNKLPVGHLIHLLSLAETVNQFVDADCKKLEAAVKADQGEEIQRSMARLEQLFPSGPTDTDPGVEEEFFHDGIKFGWRGKLWKHDLRFESRKALEQKTKAWTIGEERDDEVDYLIQLMVLHFEDLVERLTVLDRMGQTDDPAVKSSTWLSTNKEPLLAALNEARAAREQAIRDLRSILDTMEGVAQANTEGETLYKAALDEVNPMLKYYTDLQKKLTEELAKTHSDYANRSTYMESRHEVISANWKAEKLQNDIIALKKQIEEILKDIDQKEAEIVQSNIEFEAEKEARIEAQKQQLIADQKKAADDYAATVKRLESELKESSEKLVVIEKERAARDLKELQRAMDAAAMMTGLEDSRATLQNTVVQYDCLLPFLDLSVTLTTDLHEALRDFHQKIRDQCAQRTPSVCVQCIETAVNLHELLQRVQADKRTRVESIDRTMARHSTMLEFCVDTQDPNAHKHQAILDELEMAREQLADDLVTHANMETELPAKAAPVVAALGRSRMGAIESAKVAIFKDRAPAFFDEKHAKAAAPITVDIPPAPHPTHVLARVHHNGRPSTAPPLLFGRGSITSLVGVERSPTSRPTSAAVPERSPTKRASTPTALRAEIESSRALMLQQQQAAASSATATPSPARIPPKSSSASRAQAAANSELRRIADEFDGPANVSAINDVSAASSAGAAASSANQTTGDVLDFDVTGTSAGTSTLLSPTGFVLKQGRRHKVNRSVLTRSKSPANYDPSEFYVAKYPV